MDTFKGKVYYYKKIGQNETKVEKEFDNEQEFESYLKEHKSEFALPEIAWPKFTKDVRDEFKDQFNKMVSSRAMDRPIIEEKWKSLL